LGLAADLIFSVFSDKGIGWSQAGVAYALLFAAMVILRKSGMALRARRQQARRAAPGQRPDGGQPIPPS
jgi:hypothetical protein